MSDPGSLGALLADKAAAQPGAPAFVSPDLQPLSYSGLREQADHIASVLAESGIRREDRVALVMPEGAELAVAFLSISASAACAPLNPGYRASEFEFYLRDLEARALVSLRGYTTPAHDVAREMGIPLIELARDPQGAVGSFSIRPAGGVVVEDSPGEPNSVGLVLHTSGTTSRPKMVPLTHQNLIASATHVGNSLELGRSDRCLNVMPLFHIHGLVGAVLSSIRSGASVACLGPFSVEAFYRFLREAEPTWYTAVPTLHQAILEGSKGHPEYLTASRLRLIRSSSASLPPTVMERLERAFRVPVIESYGMTEAAHQMTSNPLPPKERKAGSVGQAAGPQVAIMGEGSRLAERGEKGEVVIRGPNVTSGYANNPEASSHAFSEGWFRTGDEGYFDSEGYLFLTGRLKEIINRGGEKIAPREVDEAFLRHPLVQLAVTFALPHPTLGEDIATAIVLAEGGTVSENRLRAFAFEELADFKVPSRVVLVDAIPKGPTGKLRRIGLAEVLADKLEVAHQSPRNETERGILAIWQRVLGRANFGVRDNFFHLGGDSLSAVETVTAIGAAFSVELDPPVLFQAPTVELLAQCLSEEQAALGGRSVVELRKGEPELPAFVCFPGALGNVFQDLGDLAADLADGHAVYAFQDGLHNPSRVSDLVEAYLAELRQVRGSGPYYLLGVCSGATLAFEVASRLPPEEVGFVGLIEPAENYGRSVEGYLDFAGWAVRRSLHHLTRRAQRPSRTKVPNIVRRSHRKLQWKAVRTQWCLRRHRSGTYAGTVHVYQTFESLGQKHWEDSVAGELRRFLIPGDYASITGHERPVDPLEMSEVAEKINRSLPNA